MRGRKPKPTHLKILHGTDRPDRISDDEPTPEIPDNLPTAPDFLQDDPVAMKEWVRVGSELLSAKMLSNVDITALAAYCIAYSTWVENIQKVRKQGTVFKSKSGYPVLSPFLSIANKSFEQMTKMLSEFGMTPSSRTRVRGIGAGGGDIPDLPPFDDFDSFVRRKNGGKRKK